MLEIVVPTLSTLHPLTVVNSLHSSCISKVEAANILKRDQSLSYWSQVSVGVLYKMIAYNRRHFRFIQIQNDQQPNGIYKDRVVQSLQTSTKKVFLHSFKVYW